MHEAPEPIWPLIETRAILDPTRHSILAPIKRAGIERNWQTNLEPNACIEPNGQTNLEPHTLLALEPNACAILEPAKTAHPAPQLSWCAVFERRTC